MYFGEESPWPSRAPAGTQCSSLKSMLMCIRLVNSPRSSQSSRLCLTTCGLTTRSIYEAQIVGSFICVVCLTFTSLANQCVEQRTCFKDCGCTRRSSTTLSVSQTIGLGEALVSYKKWLWVWYYFLTWVKSALSLVPYLWPIKQQKGLMFDWRWFDL